MTLQKMYKCQFCGKGFTRKSWYDKHVCDKKQRFEERHNIVSIRAHKLFTHWQRRLGLLRRGKEKGMEDFVKSPYFGVFKKLAEYGSNNSFISTFKYLDWIIDNKVKEQKWFDESNLPQFFTHLQENENPMSQARSTLLHIKKWAIDNQIRPNQFFKTISPSQVVSMVRTNQLSPWVLFGYDPALHDLVGRLDSEVIQHLNEYINVPYWIGKIEADTDGVTKVKSVLDSELAQ